MARPRNPLPKYELHKPSGSARVRWAGREVWLGKHGTPESLKEYARICAEIGAAPAAAPVAGRRATVAEVLLAFMTHAQAHYRGADGAPTSEFREHGRSILHLEQLYGHTPAAEFGPLALKAVRAAMVAAKWSRKTVNKRVSRVRHIFRWAAGEELVPVAVVEALECVAGLQKGRTAAHETDPVGPAPLADVTAALPFLDRHQRAMARLQLLTGMRPGEACVLRLCELDRTGAVWAWRPEAHKTAWRGADKTVLFGPQAQAVIAEFLAGCDADLRPKDDDWLFSPARAREERYRRLRAARKSPVQPSQASRKKAAPKRAPGARYNVSGYDHAIERACARAGVPRWSSNQLRHTFATGVRKRYGLEAAQVLLGHAKADVTQIYAERDLDLALRVAGEVG